MNCENCGATITDAGAFCSHCGTRLRRPERTEPAIRAATDPARFDLAQASPGFQSAQGHVPKITDSGMGTIMPLLMIGFCIFFMVMAVSGGAVSGHPLGLGFLLVPGVMIAIVLSAVGGDAKFARAPITKQLLVVVDERTATSGGGDTSVTTSYFATLQARDGVRQEYPTYGLVAAKIAPGDVGVAFLKGGRLVDFLRLEA